MHPAAHVARVGFGDGGGGGQREHGIGLQHRPAQRERLADGSRANGFGAGAGDEQRLVGARPQRLGARAARGHRAAGLGQGARAHVVAVQRQLAAAQR